MIGALLATSAALFVFVLSTMVYQAERYHRPPPTLAEGLALPALLVLATVGAGWILEAFVRWIAGA